MERLFPLPGHLDFLSLNPGFRPNRDDRYRLHLLQAASGQFCHDLWQRAG